jgi:DNA-binding transcriptional MerR regulator
MLTILLTFLGTNTGRSSQAAPSPRGTGTNKPKPLEEHVEKLWKPLYKRSMEPNSKLRHAFTTSDAERLTGIGRDMLHYLCRTGIVVPTTSRRNGERGHGIVRRYSFTDLVSFKVVRRLTESGVSPTKVKSAIRELHRMGVSLSNLPTSHVVIFEKSVYRWDGRGSPFRVVDGQQAFGFILDLSSIREELVAGIAAMAA